ncbi:hypothetical protein RZS08_59280, partial [Arthrospira platensis SPKY1]|nr:hypothetical protein [Arthrospira platensis SPKY1]
GMMLENLSFRLDGDDPAGVEQGGDRLRHSAILQASEVVWIIPMNALAALRKTPRGTGAWGQCWFQVAPAEGDGRPTLENASRLLEDFLHGGDGDDHPAVQRA